MQSEQFDLCLSTQQEPLSRALGCKKIVILHLYPVLSDLLELFTGG